MSYAETRRPALHPAISARMTASSNTYDIRHSHLDDQLDHYEEDQDPDRHAHDKPRGVHLAGEKEGDSNSFAGMHDSTMHQDPMPHPIVAGHCQP